MRTNTESWIAFTQPTDCVNAYNHYILLTELLAEVSVVSALAGQPNHLYFFWRTLKSKVYPNNPHGLQELQQHFKCSCFPDISDRKEVISVL
ncbi:hypothetical protein TNCV_2813821 [Trichonephila clavipes]|nr:hypothetical protein TNCV_2813821 [Trichonephila clavipes]